MKFILLLLITNLLLVASDNQVLLKTTADIDTIIDQNSIIKIEKLSTSIYLLHLRDDQNSTKFIQKVSAHKEVLYAHPNIHNKTIAR